VANLTLGPVTKEQLESYIQEAAKAAGYEGFGRPGCDLSQPVWWTGYARQSLDEQARNNRLPEYLLTLARMAKAQGVIIPLEFVFVDFGTGEHLERQAMSYLRFELAHKKRILGIMFADIRCLSREPAPQQVFERECELLEIKLVFGDAPSGLDPGSQFARSAITFSNKIARLATHNNARAGNIGRILKGMVPSLRPAYGYRYRREAEIVNGKACIKKAWWEVNELNSEEGLVLHSPAWVIDQVFTWVGLENRTSFWVAKKMNDLGIKAPGGGIWSPNQICKVIHRRCYTGKNLYNSSWYVPNPRHPLGDVTARIRRTVSRPKPKEEWVPFAVPAMVSEVLWEKANQALTSRGRGRGKQGKTIQALLRNRIFCPRCGKPMVVRRDGKRNEIYYHCSRHYRPWDSQACAYRRFIPGSWDNAIWDFVFALLTDNAWVEAQLVAEETQEGASSKLLHIEISKIGQIKSRIAKVQEGFEAGIYGVEEAKIKIADHQNSLVMAEKEIDRLSRISKRGLSSGNVDTLRKGLKDLARKNMDKADFEERLDIITKLDVKVYPSEDLRTMRVRCGLNITRVDVDDSATQCGKIIFGPPKVSAGRTETLSPVSQLRGTGRVY
jgi:site-specific DNA recombinase